MASGGRGGKDWPEDDDKHLKKCLQSDKGVLVVLLSLNLLRPPSQEIHVYPVQNMEGCRYPGMRYQMRRYASFSALSFDISLSRMWPSRLALDGFFFHIGFDRIICYFCDGEYNHHLPGCRRQEENLPPGQGVRDAHVFPFFHELTSAGRRLMQLRGVCVVEDRVGDESLDVLNQRCRPPSDDDHDIHTVAVAGPSSESNMVPVTFPVRPPEEARTVFACRNRSISTAPTEHVNAQPVQRDPIRHPNVQLVPGEGGSTANPGSTQPVQPSSYPVLQLLPFTAVCKLCRRQWATTLFFPCRHTVCSVCAQQGETCPLCNRHISGSGRQVSDE